MIISASRRTDIPAWYSEWLVNRIRAGYVLVRNPINPRQVGRVSLSPDVVDGMVFWTKNPGPMLGRLEAFRNYPYYFQFTLTPYGRDIESNLPSKRDVLIPTFQRLADRVGPRRVIWRYDPILLSKQYPVDYHLETFEKMVKALHGYARKCTFSFIDLYQKTLRNAGRLALREATEPEMRTLAAGFAEIAASYHLVLDTCAEKIDLSEFGIGHASCIDKTILEELAGWLLEIAKDPNQRTECGCCASIDIGLYDTCANGCLYCYANSNPAAARRNLGSHRPDSALLIGDVTERDVVKERNIKSCRIRQLSMLNEPAKDNRFCDNEF
ncbi:MAG: DUF1848 domain-containing protein [Eubacteriales bacterium]|nr:DUF1848 domain-containing protein [Eubacteriales bacterium]